MRALNLAVLIAFLVNAGTSVSQREITLEAIWKDNEFQTESVPGFNFLKDGLHYTKTENQRIEKYSFATGQKVSTLFNASDYKGKAGFNGMISSYEFSEDESKILIKSQSERIYRRSTIAFFYVFESETQNFVKIFDKGKISFATFSPDASNVAFVFSNNIYIQDLEDNQMTRVTNDGEYNSIINGAADWVYEEEFAMSKAFNWSSDSEKIAFMRFDESKVKQFSLYSYDNGLYPEQKSFKYPKVGEKNADISVHIYNVSDAKTIDVDLGDLNEMYVPRIKWTQDKNKLSVIKMNRHQNHLELFLVNAKNGESEVILEEINKYYIRITNNLSFLDDGKHFVWTSEKSGFNHIYLYDMKGIEKKQITQGKFDVTAFYGIDEKNHLIYYQSAEVSPLQRQVYSINLDNGIKTLITDFNGTNRVQYSDTYDYFVWTKSTINTPPLYEVHDRNGKLVRSIEDNHELVAKQKEYGTLQVEFTTIVTSEGTEMNAYWIMPENFNENRKYPVFMYIYGGPGSQQVSDGWKGQNYWWFQMLAKSGYMIACVDNRGTGARGEEFRKMTYLKLGHYETIDQIEAAKYLASLPYTDPLRVGIFGWSYGGFMSTSCLLKGNDVFKAAIAVAPVTHWKWYDTIYTERYMRTLEENAKGYEDNSPVNFADRLKGNYLLIHGMGDDNVHFQHSVEMAKALIEANKQFDTYYYPNKTHGISGGLTRLHLYTKMTDFIFEKL